MKTLGYVGWAGWGWLGLAWLCRWLYYTFFENRLKAMAKSSTLSSWTWNKCGSEWQNWNSVLWTSKWTRSRAYPTTVGHVEVEEMEGRVKYLGQHYVYWCVSVVTHFREPAYERSVWFCFNSLRVYMRKAMCSSWTMPPRSIARLKLSPPRPELVKEHVPKLAKVRKIRPLNKCYNFPT